MPDKIQRTDIELVGDVPCIVFSGNGKSLYFPANGIQAVFEDAMRRFNAFQAQREVAAGQWKPALIVEPQTWNTGTTDSGKVAVVVDRGQPTEQTFALSGDHAKQLGQQLLETAARSSQPPKRN